MIAALILSHQSPSKWRCFQGYLCCIVDSLEDDWTVSIAHHMREIQTKLYLHKIGSWWRAAEFKNSKLTLRRMRDITFSSFPFLLTRVGSNCWCNFLFEMNISLFLCTKQSGSRLFACSWCCCFWLVGMTNCCRLTVCNQHPKSKVKLGYWVNVL